MIDLTDEEFEQTVSDAIDALPKKYAEKMNNVGFVVEAEPTAEQRAKLHLVNGQMLFGLYEGIPLTQRTGGYSLVLPDKITIFMDPIVAACETMEQLKEQVRYTVWHEVAHHFGLGHDQIYKLGPR